MQKKLIYAIIIVFIILIFNSAFLIIKWQNRNSLEDQSSQRIYEETGLTKIFDKPIKKRFLDPRCQITGCFNSLCLDSKERIEIPADCKEEVWYVCYNFANCEVQNDGHCDWTLNNDYQECLYEKAEL